MSQSTHYTQALSRRLLGTYLMFGLLSIAAVAASLVLIGKYSSAKTAGNTLLSRMGESAEQIANAYRADNGAAVQAIVEELGRSTDLLYSSVVSPEGIYLAHSNPALVGRRAAHAFGGSTASGVIERISYLREDNTGPREYWVPLRHQKSVYGMLQVGVQSRAPADLFSFLKQYAGTIVVLPLALLLSGGFALRQTVKASSNMESQLKRLANQTTTDEMQLRPIEESGLAAKGWNQLVARSAKGQFFNSLEARLNDALGGMRDEKHEHILQGLVDGVAATNEEGIITFANNAFAVIMNSSPEELCGTSVEDLVLRELPDNNQEFCRQMKEAARPGVVEMQRSQNLEDGVLRLARYPSFSDDGKTLTQIWLLRDITQQKLIEYTRDEFVNTATHELRTPLSTIKACAETLELEEGIDLELQKQYLNNINMEATRLGRFLDEFLDISRMEAGSLAAALHEIDFDRLLSDVIAKVRPQMELKQIDFQVLLPPKMPKLKLDKDKVSAALVNLLGNAAKYTPESGQVKLQVELGENEIRVQVEDSGIGIAAEELPKVFNRFYRSDDERVRDINGTGLGLAFSQEVIRLHGGTISAKSEFNRGSRFTVTLPLA